MPVSFNFNPRKRKSMSSSGSRKKSAFRRQTFSSQRGVPTRFAVPPKKVELKYHDSNDTITIPGTGTIAQLTNIPNGTGPSDRIGRRVAYHDIQINFHWSPASGASTRARAILVHDTQTNNAATTVGDVMNGYDVAALYNPDNRIRFNILYDTEVMTHQSANFFFSTGEAGKRNVVVSLKGKQCLFSGTGSSVSDIEKGNLFWVCLSDTAGGMDFVSRSRMQYFD